MKKLPYGIQNFKEIIENNYVYVDKTQYVYNLIYNEKYYFLSRPRRFGKSLLLDTIAEAFSGEKTLFKGLYLYDSDYHFKKHPILRLDMSNIPNKTPEVLETSLSEELMDRIKKENLKIVSEIPAILFKRLIEGLYIKYNQRVVVLIDEYDSPLLDHLDEIETAEANRKVLRGFYGILKSMDPFLRHVFITGVSKFTKTSVFSGMNNLRDITLSEEYANICGVTIEDLGKYFKDHMEKMETFNKFKKYKNISDEILSWYDGYSWDGETRVINPFSLLGFFTEKKFSSFWYASGTPKFLIDMIKKDPHIYTNLKNYKMTESMLDASEINSIAAEPLFFQTGYLTIKEIIFTKRSTVYMLDMPNFEVREAFNFHVLTAFTEKEQSRVKQAQLEIDEALQKNDMHKMLEILRSLFAAIPYQLHISLEAYYHSIFYAVMNVLGFEIDAEVSVSGGRVDAVLELDDLVYIIEFKYKHCPPDTSADIKKKRSEEALEQGMAQINDRGYYKKYIGSGKKITQAVFVFLGRDEIEMKVDIRPAVEQNIDASC